MNANQESDKKSFTPSGIIIGIIIGFVVGFLLKEEEKNSMMNFLKKKVGYRDEEEEKAGEIEDAGEEMKGNQEQRDSIRRHFFLRRKNHAASA